jgi:hypothetical protein
MKNGQDVVIIHSSYKPSNILLEASVTLTNNFVTAWHMIIADAEIGPP